MDCSNCSAALRPESEFCHSCGARVQDQRIQRGRAQFRVFFVLTVGLSALQVIPSFFMAWIWTGQIDFGSSFDLVSLGFLLFLFLILYRGHRWPKFVLGFYFILASAIRISLGLLGLLGIPLGGFSVLFVVMGAFFTILAVFMLRSKDLDLFVRQRRAEEEKQV
jgi:hypothetical protein